MEGTDQKSVVPNTCPLHKCRIMIIAKTHNKEYICLLYTLDYSAVVIVICATTFLAYMQMFYSHFYHVEIILLPFVHYCCPVVTIVFY